MNTDKKLIQEALSVLDSQLYNVKLGGKEQKAYYDGMKTMLGIIVSKNHLKPVDVTVDAVGNHKVVFDHEIAFTTYAEAMLFSLLYGIDADIIAVDEGDETVFKINYEVGSEYITNQNPQPLF